MNIFDYITLFLSCVADIYICKGFITSFYEKNGSNRFCTYRIFDLAAIILLFLVNLIGIADINLIIAPIIVFFYIKFTCKINILSTVMSLLIVLSALLGGEFIFVVLLNVTSPDSAMNLSEMPWMTFATKLVSYIILVFIIQVSNRSQKRLHNKIFWMYLLIPVASLGMMFTTYFIVENAIDDSIVKAALLASFVLMLLGNISVFNAFNKYGEELQKTMEQELIISRERMNKEHYARVEALNDERQTLIHDLKHYVRTANLLICQEEYDKAKNILENLDMKICDNEKQIYSKNPMIDVVLSDKANYAKSHEISFIVNVEPTIDFEKVNMPDYVIMIANLLDNALQAVERCQEKREVSVNLFISDNEGFFVSKIKNNFNPAYLKIEADELITTKQNKSVHGLGIKSVRNIANNNSGYYSYKIEDDYFISILALPV